MNTLNLNSIELVTTERRAPLNGAPSSANYNDSMTEILADLAAISDILNTSVLPLLSSLPVTDPLTLDGDGIYASHDATSALFFDSTAKQPLTIAAVLLKINANVLALTGQVTDLAARVLAVQTRLGSTNQNDIAKALQGFADTLQQVTNRVAALENQRG